MLLAVGTLSRTSGGERERQEGGRCEVCRSDVELTIGVKRTQPRSLRFSAEVCAREGVGRGY